MRPLVYVSNRSHVHSLCVDAAGDVSLRRRGLDDEERLSRLTRVRHRRCKRVRLQSQFAIKHSERGTLTSPRASCIMHVCICVYIYCVGCLAP